MGVCASLYSFEGILIVDKIDVVNSPFMLMRERSAMSP